MCQADAPKPTAANDTPAPSSISTMRRRRRKRDKQDQHVHKDEPPVLRRHAKQPHKSGILEVLLPSLIGVLVLVSILMGRMGFRGRETVAGIDLGTTNSVICVQAQTEQLGITCIPDPNTNSSVIPSVVSLLETTNQPIVGQEAKNRIDTHPERTLYNAKRVLGRPFSDPAVSQMKSEVEFIVTHDKQNNVAFAIDPQQHPLLLSPIDVGTHIVRYLSHVANQHLGHDNVKTAVICVPAKFDARQRQDTVQAFRNAGWTVARIMEEPTAAALAYGLHKKENIEYILVYDFGGGTLDVSLLHVSEGFVDSMGTDGDDRLGGSDFDIAIANYWLQKLQEQVHRNHKHMDLSCEALHDTPLCTVSSLHTIGEQLKIQLSDAFYENPNQDDYLVSSTCLSVDPDQPTLCSALQTIDLTLSLSEFRILAQPLWDRSIAPVTRLLNDLDLEEVDEIVMVGGTTRMPQIRQLVQAALPGSQLNTHIDPDLTVAYGAASVVD